MKSLWIWCAVAALVLVIGVYTSTVYNSLVRANIGVDTQWAQVESQYQRRYDLVPNLVNSVKGIMRQEQDVFTALGDARTKYGTATNADQKAAAAGEFEGALGRLLVVVENYPELKSAYTVQTLMAELAGTENRISVERMRYNEVVSVYNVSVKTFPRSFIAALFGFGPRTLFEAKSGADTVPEVQL